MDLAQLLKDNYSYANEEEQKEFEEFIKNYDDADEGEELSIKDIL